MNGSSKLQRQAFEDAVKWVFGDLTDSVAVNVEEIAQYFYPGTRLVTAQIYRALIPLLEEAIAEEEAEGQRA